MEKERIGLGDLMERQRLKPSGLQKSLIENDVPGNWKGKNGLQNVYNMINGTVVPRDAYVFVFLSDFLETSVTEVLMRFTRKHVEQQRYDGEKIDW